MASGKGGEMLKADCQQFTVTLYYILIFITTDPQGDAFQRGTQGAADMLYCRSLYRRVDRWTGSVPYTAPV